MQRSLGVTSLKGNGQGGWMVLTLSGWGEVVVTFESLYSCRNASRDYKDFDQLHTLSHTRHHPHNSYYPLPYRIHRQ